MSAVIKAIETRYKGYRFRSRMEARWGVFFDAAGIEWQYEPEGFKLSNGECYLPDFFLPGFHNRETGLYVEIKPTGGDLAKPMRLAAELRVCVLLAEGEPAGRHYRMACPMDGEQDCLVWDACFYAKYLPGGSCGDEYRMYMAPHTGELCAPWEAIYAARAARFDKLGVVS